MAGGIILIVANHGAMRAALGDIMRHAFPGQPVLETAHGAGAALALPAARPELVLLDLATRPDDWQTVLGQFAARARSAPILVIGQPPAKIHLEAARARGAFDYIEADRLHLDLRGAAARALAAAKGTRRGA